MKKWLAVGALLTVYFSSTCTAIASEFNSTDPVPPKAAHASYWIQNSNMMVLRNLQHSGNTLLGIREGAQSVQVYISDRTTVWDNGKMVPYGHTPKIPDGSSCIVIFSTQAEKIVAKEIYAPRTQVSGIVQNVSGNVLIIREVQMKNVGHYTGRVLKVAFDTRTYFGSSSPKQLKRERLVQCQVTGFLPGELLVQGISIYTRKNGMWVND